MANDIHRHGIAWLCLVGIVASLLRDTRLPYVVECEEERQLIREGQRKHDADGVQRTAEPPGWRELLRYRQVWAIVLARFLTDPVWWLYISWLPKYLADARGFSLVKIGLFAWVPYVAAMPEVFPGAGCRDT